jgi:DNA-binding beta-propeller fold protein YncE
VAVDAAGNVYVADTDNHRVQKFAPDGRPLAQWDTGQSLAMDVAVDREGQIYVAENPVCVRRGPCLGGASGIQKIGPSGEVLSRWETEGSGAGEFHSPRGMAVDGAGNVYVADTNNHRIQKLSPSGQPLAQWGIRGNGGPGALNLPQGVAVDAAGGVYVADTDNGRVQKLIPERVD